VARRTGRPAAEIDLDDTGTRLGLDSLALLELQHEIESAFQIELSPQDLYADTLRDLARRIEARSPAPPAGEASQAAVEARRQLSHGQQGLWLLDRLTDAGAAYNLAGAIQFEPGLDQAVLELALQMMAERHDALHTTFESGPDGPVRVVAARRPAPLAVHLGARPDGEVLSQLAAIPFDLEHDPLLRADLWPQAPGGPVLLLTVHHVAADLWSAGLLLRELAACYQDLITGVPPALPAAGSYDEFVAWQSGYLRSDAGRAASEYWRRQLAGELPWLALPTDRPRPQVQSFRGGQQPFSLSPALSRRLAVLARAEGTSLYTVLLSAFLVLLHRWSGQDDVLVGSPTSGRTRSATARTVGYFVNPVVLRGQFAADPSFRILLASTSGQVSQALMHQDYPFALLAKQLRSVHDPSRSPVFQAMFILQDAPFQEPALALAAIGHQPGAFELHGLRMRAIPVDQPTAQFDVTLAMAKDGTDQLHGSLQYNADLFDAGTADRMVGNFLTLLESITADPGTPVGRLAAVPAAERTELLHRWNSTRRELPSPCCVHEQFGAVAQQRPDAPAVILRDETLTYAELADGADRIAGRLRAAGVGPGRLVGICAKRSPQLIQALLGILSTGAAYVPLDPGYPARRLAQVLADTRPPVILADHPSRGRLPETTAVILPIEEPSAGRADPVRAAAPARPEPGLSLDHAAYVLHTSGSTGEPKGVVVSHGNVVNFFAGVDERVGCGPGDTLLAVTSVAFDISVLELLWTVTRGARVIIVEDKALGRRASGLGTGRTRPLDLSLFYFASADTASAGYHLVTEGAKFADQHGFTAVWTPERHFHEFGGLYPNPSVLSAALATITERIALRAGSVVLPLHDPIRVAEEWSLVDNLSGGRVGVAFASGWHANDFVFFPERYQERREYLASAMRVVHDLWQGHSVKVKGGSGTDVEVRIHPAPVQPTLPTWITAAGTPETFERAGQAGANVLTHLLGQTIEQVALNIRRYRQARAEHGHDPERGVVTMMLHTFVGRDEEQIRETVREPFTAYLRSSVGLIEGLVRSMNLPLDLTAMSESDFDALLAFAFDRYFESSALFGTVESVQPMLERLCAADVDEVACLIDFGLPSDIVLDHLDQLVAARSRQHAVASEETWSLAETVRRYQPTLFQCTPSMMRMIAHDQEAMAALGSLKVLLLGGEELPAVLAEQIRAELPHTRLINMYGPTEATVWAAAHEVTETCNPVPIGLPLVNTQLYILSSSMEPVLLGAAGELFIGGHGVAQGYWNQAATTADRFVPDPFSADPGGRLYRTGDLARRRADGMVEFLGRTDRQVKIQGHRIELGDIEDALQRIPEVAEAVVVPVASAAGETRLAAYLVTAAGAQPSQAELAQRLRSELPASLVPAVFVTLPELPLTSNGKIDVRALPKTIAAGPAGRSGAAPSSELERQIAGVWSEVLGVDEIGLYDNFFDIGGHSLLMVQVHSRLRDLLEGELPLIKLLEHPSVGSLAAYLVAATPQASFRSTEDRAVRQRESRRQARPPARPSGAAHP
jgi:natural product biosynthesis luciferase-like monooxygenase protein